MSATTYVPSPTIGRSWTGSLSTALRAVLLTLVIVVLTGASFFAGRATVHSHAKPQPAPIVVSGGSSAPSCHVNRPC